MSKQLPNDMDQVTKNLNKLCRLTPEGYMITIEQREFEGREYGGDLKAPLVADKASGSKFQNLSKEVEKKF